MQLQLALMLILLALMVATQLSQHTREKDRTVRNMSKRKNKTSKRRMKRQTWIWNL